MADLPAVPNGDLMVGSTAQKGRLVWNVLLRQRKPFCLMQFIFYMSVYLVFYWDLWSSFLNLLNLIHRQNLCLYVYVYLYIFLVNDTDNSNSTYELNLDVSKASASIFPFLSLNAPPKHID